MPPSRYTLRPRVYRNVNYFELFAAVSIGIVSGVYIFNDTLRHMNESTVPGPMFPGRASGALIYI